MIASAVVCQRASPGVGPGQIWPVAAGASAHTLSDEEAEAIRIAVEGTQPR